MSDSGSKSWFKEIVLGVSITVAATAIVSRLGLDRPAASDSEKLAGMGPSIIGKWEQSVSPGGPWYSGGTYRVALQNGRLVMLVQNNATVVDEFTNTRGLTDVEFDGKDWSFNSHLETGEVLQFKLRQTNDDLYEGHAYNNKGERLCANRWTRLK